MIDELVELEAALRAIAPGHTQVGALPISAAHEATLHPEEAAIVATAVARRRHEFATGRALLRSMLRSEGPVLVLTSRAPRLPAGFVASLAHDDHMVIAVTADSDHVAAIGVDLESIGAVDDDLVASVLRHDEQMLDPTAAFVAKEAAYKAWSNSGGSMLDHHDVRIRCADASHPVAFTAEIVAHGKEVHGMLTRTSSRWLAIAVIDAPR
jgi:4'-phosphopantetheinyl transferase EntD